MLLNDRIRRFIPITDGQRTDKHVVLHIRFARFT